MTRDRALREARKRWGRRAAIRAEGDISSPEKRQAAKERATSLKAQKSEIEAEIKRREIAAGIPELYAQIKALNRPITVETWEAIRHRFAVGYVDNILGCFHIEAEGDTWEEAFAEAERRTKARAS